MKTGNLLPAEASRPRKVRPSSRRVVAVAVARRRKRGVEWLLVESRGGALTLPKGGVHQGESKIKAARRETVEEAGWKVRRRDVKFSFRYRHLSRQGRLQKVDAFVAVGGERVRRPRQERWRGRRWLSADEALRHPQVPRELAKALQRASGNL